MYHKALMLASCAGAALMCSISASDDGVDPAGGGFDPNAKLTIKIPKDNGKSETVIRGSVNGQSYEVAVNQEVPVPAAVAQAISDSGIKYEVVGDAGAGLPAASTAPLTDTATRLVPNVDPLKPGGDGDVKVPTLEGGEGDTGRGGASAAEGAEAREAIEGAANAEGQGVGASGGARTGDDSSGKAQADPTKGEGNAEGQGSTPAKDPAEGKPDPDKAPEPEQSDETVDQLKERIGKVDDVDALRAEHDAEVKGKGRTTALAAIDARIDALTHTA